MHLKECKVHTNLAIKYPVRMTGNVLYWKPIVACLSPIITETIYPMMFLALCLTCRQAPMSLLTYRQYKNTV